MRKGMNEADVKAWTERITGPVRQRVLFSGGTTHDVFVFTLNHAGVDHVGVCQAGVRLNEQERLFAECCEDLAGFVGGFVAFGCGWPGHEFDGDITDPNAYLECVKCGAAKLKNQRLEAPSLAGA